MKADILCSGALFCAKSTKRILFLHRANGSKIHQWGIVGGKTIEGETPWEGLKREIEEEVGFYPDVNKTIPLETFVSNDTKFQFHTYMLIVNEEFIPRLNHEHDGYAWCSFNSWPKPLHNGLRSTFNNTSIKNKLLTVLDIIQHI